MAFQNRHVRRRGLEVWMGVLASGLLAAAPAAWAGVIGPGFDVYKTQPSSWWDFSSNSISANFFGPGSDPFEGQVPIYTVTKVERPGGADFPGGEQTVPVEIVSMNLHSVEPIDVTFEQGLRSEQFDVFITLDTRPSLPHEANTGQYRMSHNPLGQPDGGMILDSSESFFDLFIEMQFSSITGGSVVDGLYRDQHMVLTTSVPWAHRAPARYFRSDCDFYPGVDPEDPTDAGPAMLVYKGSEFNWEIRLAAVPEPATMALLGLAACGLGGYVRRRRKA